MSARREWIGVLILCAVWLAIQLIWFQDAFLFHGDHERDLRYATLWVNQGIFPDSSPSISPLPFELGPLLYLLLAPIVAISPDPMFVRGVFLVLTALGLGLFFATWRRRVRWEAALFSIFLLGASTFIFEMGRQLWHSSLLALPLAGFFWASERLLSAQAKIRHAAIAGACAAVAVQLHMSATTYALILIGLLLFLAPRRGWRAVGASALTFLVVLLPFMIRAIGSIRGGALRSVSAGGRGWAPAGLGTVLDFFVDNIHTIWGDNLGPLLTWPVVLLIAWGAWCVVRKRQPFGLLLLAAVGVGFIVELLLLGNQQAHRYMHANIWPAFGLVAFGLDDLLDRLRWRWLPIALATLAGVVTVEALISEVPHTSKGGWLNALEQRAVAQVVAEEYPLPEEAMETRVHGIYFGEPMGMAHLDALYRRDTPAFSDSAHLLIMPEDLGLLPHASSIQPAHVVRGAERSIRVFAYEPALDYSTMTIESPLDKALLAKWRRPQSTGHQKQSDEIHTLRIQTKRAGRVHLVISDGRSKRDQCPVAMWAGDSRLTPKQVNASGYHWLRFVAFEVPGPAPITVRVGPCRAVRFLDLW